MAWAIQRGVLYNSFSSVLEAEDGKSQAYELAKEHFIGRKVFTCSPSGFGGTDDVVEILPPIDISDLFIIRNKEGKLISFHESWGFEIEA